MSAVQWPGPLTTRYYQKISDSDENGAQEMLDSFASLRPSVRKIDVGEHFVEEHLSASRFDEALRVIDYLDKNEISSLFTQACKVICYLKKIKFEKAFPYLKTLVDTPNSTSFVEERIKAYTEAEQQTLAELFSYLLEKMRIVSEAVKAHAEAT